MPAASQGINAQEFLCSQHLQPCMLKGYYALFNLLVDSLAVSEFASIEGIPGVQRAGPRSTQMGVHQEMMLSGLHLV